MQRFAAFLRPIHTGTVQPSLGAGGPAARRATAALLLVLGAVACGGRGGSGAVAANLPSYQGRAAQLFDDTIEPASVGLDFSRSYTPKSDPKLRERVSAGDAVLRVRITTVTSRNDGPEPSYQLGLSTLETLHGEMAEGRFQVQVLASNESHGIVKSLDGRLVGKPFIAFVRRFGRADGEPIVHFHLTSDTDEVKAAVSNAVVLDGLR